MARWNKRIRKNLVFVKYVVTFSKKQNRSSKTDENSPCITYRTTEIPFLGV